MNGVLWSGPSAIDGKPVVAILTGSEGKSQNRKTGNIQQVWILRSDISPIDAVKAGEDYSICADCPNRGDGHGKKRACYVSIFRGPLAVYKKFRRGGHAEGAKINGDRPVRFGAYGEPSLLPIELVKSIAQQSKGHVGYSHRWRELPKEYAKYFMASTNSEEESAEAKEAGWRSFLALPIGKSVPRRMFNCPASEEAGHLTQCEKCLRCNGGMGRDIWIRAHGRGKNFVK